MNALYRQRGYESPFLVWPLKHHPRVITYRLPPAAVLRTCSLTIDGSITDEMILSTFLLLESIPYHLILLLAGKCFDLNWVIVFTVSIPAFLASVVGISSNASANF